MTRHVTFEVPENDTALDIIDMVMEHFGRVGVWLVRARTLELTDDEMAEDVNKLLTWDQRLEAMEHAVSAGEPPPEADPTPPHGIERKVMTGGAPYLRPADYWVDEHKHYVTGSMQRPIPDINAVQCPTCGAGVGERCITSNHVGYRDGFAHTARRHIYQATQA